MNLHDVTSRDPTKVSEINKEDMHLAVLVVVLGDSYTSHVLSVCLSQTDLSRPWSVALSFAQVVDGTVGCDALRERLRDSNLKHKT